MSLQKIQITALFSFLLVLSNFSILSAQNKDVNDFSKNVIHGSVGTFIVSYSAHLGYDKLIASKNGFFKSYYASLKIGGITAIDFSGSGGGTGQTANVGVTGLTGGEKNHFELGLGLGYYRDSVILENDSDDSTFYPHLTVGYRLQKSTGLMFRTGVGIAEYAYVGIGYSF